MSATKSTDTTQTILLADDDPLILDLVERTLQKEGYKTLRAESGEQAIEIAMVKPFDLAVLDYRMGGMNGVETGMALHRLTQRRFVIMTQNKDRQTMDEAAAKGAMGFIAKPISAADLVGQVGVAIERSRDIDGLYENSIIVNTAIGILMERLHLPRGAAHEKIKKQARSERRKLVDVAAEIIRVREEYYQTLA